MAVRALIVGLLALIVCGCTSEPPAATAKKQADKVVEPKKDDQRATASGSELTVNPNGSLTTPGSKLGGNK